MTPMMFIRMKIRMSRNPPRSLILLLRERRAQSGMNQGSFIEDIESMFLGPFIHFVPVSAFVLDDKVGFRGAVCRIPCEG